MDKTTKKKTLTIEFSFNARNKAAPLFVYSIW